jgi:hypothetical protein
MEVKRRPCFKAIRTEMRLSGALEKTAAAETVRMARSLNQIPTGLADNPFLGSLKESRT